MLDVLRARGFAPLLAGNLVSSLGSWLLVVAVPYHVFRLTGSIGATGLTLAAESLPALLVGPVAGVFVDRWARRDVMIAADVVAAVALLGIPLADRPDRLGWLYAALVLENLALVFFRPAARALLPAIVGTGTRLAGANSLIAVNNGIIRLAGPPLGALLLTVFGLPALVFADLASYLFAALAVALIRAPVIPAAVRTGVLGELRAGLSFALRHRPLAGLLSVTFLFWTANAVFTALLVPLMTLRFGNRPDVIGVQLSALGAGYLAGGPIGGRLVRDRSPESPLMIGLVGVGCCFGVLANAHSVPVAVLAVGLAGLPGSLLLVTTETTIQRATPEPLRGRVGAVFFASDAAAALAGATLGAGLGGPRGLAVLLTTSAGVMVLLAGVVPLLMRRPIGPNPPVTLFDGRSAGQPRVSGRASKTSQQPGI